MSLAEAFLTSLTNAVLFFEVKNTSKNMRHGSLFSGIGGFDLAARWMGWENVFHSEIDPFCLSILKHHFPDAITYTDIRNTDFTPWRDRIDVLSGGFPCQPFSQAGKRKGTADDRHLWPEMLRAIREIRPRWVVGENVLGITNWDGGVVFEQVCADLENEGYSVQPVVLPACGVGAPHQRYRTWFVAHRNDDELFAGLPLPEQIWAALAADGGIVDDSHSNGDRGQESRVIAEAQRDEEPLGAQDRPAGEPCRANTFGDERRNAHGYVSHNTGGYGEIRYCPGTFTDPDGVRQENVPSDRDGQNHNAEQRGDVHGWLAHDGPERTFADTPTARLEGEIYRGEQEGAGAFDFIRQSPAGCGVRDAADTPQFSLQDEFHDATGVGETYRGQAAGGSEYGDLSKDWKDFPTVTPVLRGDDGLSEVLHGITFPRWRKESIKAYGNAIVPQIAYRIFRVIEFMSGEK